MVQLLLALLLFSPPVQPLGLPWQSELTDNFRDVSGFKYLYGDLNWGRMRFLGSMRGFETELLLEFSRKYIYEATLIMGPKGFSEESCLSTYKFFEKLLAKKYGPNFTRMVRKDPVIDDLLYVRRCHAIRIGVEEISAKWRTSNFVIELILFGDDEIFLEINYRFISRWHNAKKEEELKLLRSL